MPILEVSGTKLHYDERGGGAETLVLAHGLLFSGRMFERQVEALSDRFRCVTFDFRGQGASEVTSGGYDMDTLAGDAAGLIETLGYGPCHFAGLSMGGFVGLRLASRRPDLLRSLTLISSSANPEPVENVAPYRRMAFVARWLGTRIVARRIERIVFGPAFLTDPGRAAERRAWRRRLVANDRVGISRAALGVIAREGVEGELARIRLPTLILVGDRDVATPPVCSERMHARIEGSRLVVIPGAGHTLTIEVPDAVSRAMLEFLETPR